jgi:nucleotide-binding universal stress UspA family protein
VVLGADDSPSSASAVEEAFVEAEQRDAQLHAVRVASPAITRAPITPADHDKALAEEREALARILADARARHPDVLVQEDVVLGQLGWILIQLSEMPNSWRWGRVGKAGSLGCSWVR